MKFSSLSVAAVLGLANLSLAAPAPLFALPIVQHVAPESKKCAAKNADCRTAEQAAPLIAKGMYDYGIYNVKEMAAILSLMALESGDFKYKRNQFPGRPGQGTSNMQMAPFNLLYAKSIPELADKYKDINNATTEMNEKQLGVLLDDVTDDKYNFASAQWFLTTQCDPEVRTALQGDVDEGFKVYMECIGVTADDPDRLAKFKLAKQAFGLEKC
ncbi:hypothetical protein ACHAPT_006641 [Fusarium lateritium]